MLISSKEYLSSLSYGSKKRIDIKCDYCENVFNRSYSHHLRMNKSTKDYCRKCIQTKNVEEFLNKINSNQVDEIIKYIIDNGSTKISGVYSIVNKSNNKSYIGSSKDLIYRFKSHIDEINNGTHHCKEFNYIDIGNLEFIVIDFIIDTERLVDLEYNYINLFKTNELDIGYNIMSKRKGTVNLKTNKNKNAIFRLKLTVSEVEQIKNDLYEGILPKEIYIKYNINPSTVFSIKNCDIWSDILPDLNSKLKSIKYKGIQKGVLNGSSKLTELQVREIKNLLSSGDMTMTDIGKQYKVSRTLIGHIKRGKLWSHVV